MGKDCWWIFVLNIKTREYEMTKQEMTEWLAENVLNMKHYEEMGNCGAHWETGPGIEYKVIRLETGRELEEFIYSPEGFFAVWGKCGVEVRFYPALNEVGIMVCYYKSGHGEGQDRYEAFYNAVFKAFKE